MGLSEANAPHWYVITGGPSTGKTTLLDLLEERGFSVVSEAARTVIDDAADRGISASELRADEKAFQEEVARVKKKIEQTTDQRQITFFDRGMHDTLAYLQSYDFEIADWIEDLLKGSVYRRVFVLDPLPDYQEDYARTEDEDFRTHINQLLDEAYSGYGMRPIHVPVMSPTERADFIMKYVEEDQS